MGKATPVIGTTASAASVVVGNTTSDTAIVSGGYGPTGTVTFTLYNNATGTGPALFTDANEPLSGGAASSKSYTTTAAGTDYWVATYNGDANNVGVASGIAAEPLTVSKATPVIGTTVSAASVVVGNTTSDTAIVSGGYGPTGTVTFTLYNNATGAGPALFTDANEPLSAGAANSKSYTTTATGTDYWVATYNGDANNVSVASGLAAEPVTVSKATPAIGTTASAASVATGYLTSDTAIVSGGYGPTGTVTFTLYNNATGTGPALFTDADEPLSGGAASSKSYTTTGAGTDYWVATYNGDANNVGVVSGLAAEPVTVIPPKLAINTTVSAASVVVGGATSDIAIISGGYSPTGTVTFNLYNNAAGTGPVLVTDADEPLSGGAASSKSYTTTATGTDYWVATYNGDANNDSVASGVAAEPVTVNKATPAIGTTVSAASVVVGNTTSDTATVSGGYSPTGTVTFTLYNNASGTGPALFTDANEPLSGGAASSTSYTTTGAGTDYWVATYNGDANNVSVVSGLAAEPLTVNKATPVIGTTVSAGSVVVGNTTSDTATVSGGYSPTATVTFTLYNNATGTGPALFTDANEPLSAGVASSKSYTTTVTGTEYWVATYNGDANNVSVASGVAVEPLTVSQATPTIGTTVSAASVVVGNTTSDTATISGGYGPTGTVTFTLYNNATGTGHGAVHGRKQTAVGGAASSKSYTTTATGTDYWVATYNGDANNVSVASGVAAEPVTVGKATPAIGTTVSAASVAVGDATSDTATVSGGYSPTGTVTFNLYNNATGTGPALFTDADEPLSGGAASSKSYTTTALGSDYWVATYNGDANNVSVASGVAAELLTVRVTPTIGTTVSAASVVVGNTTSDTATVSTDYGPTGTVTFNLYNNANGDGAGAVHGRQRAAVGRRGEFKELYDHWRGHGLLGGDVQRRRQQHQRRQRPRRGARDGQQGHAGDQHDGVGGQRRGGEHDLRHGDGLGRLQPDGHGDVHPVQQRQRHGAGAVHGRQRAAVWRRGEFEELYDDGNGHGLLGGDLQRRRQQRRRRQRRRRGTGDGDRGEQQPLRLRLHGHHRQRGTRDFPGRLQIRHPRRSGDARADRRGQPDRAHQRRRFLPIRFAAGRRIHAP